MGTLLVLLFFGTLELGLVMQSRARVTDATRDGVRTAASLARVDGYQNNALATVQGALGDQPIDRVTIYRADPNTGLPLSGESLEACSIDCWQYADLGGVLTQVSGPEWPADDQSACGGVTDNDWIGVYVRSHHKWITGILPGQRDLTDHVVMRLEPVEEGVQCRKV